MQALVQSTAASRLSAAGVVGSGTDWTAPESLAHEQVGGLESMRVPRLVPISRALGRILSGGGVGGPGVVLLIDEQGIWRSSEDWLPPTLLRQRGGCGPQSGDFAGHPGTVFAAHECAELSSMLACCLAGGLGFVAASIDGGGAVRVNHDGNGWISGGDAALLSSVADLLSNAGT